MALTQMQLIQSLGEAMAWFEKELSWGVPPQELRHLCSRIGELYTALIFNGQMANSVNQKGYDVVSGNGERISVKTTTMNKGSGHISFNANTIDLVDRIVILQINYEEMQIDILFNESVVDSRKLMSQGGDNKSLQMPLSKILSKSSPKRSLSAVNDELFEDVIIREMESGSIELIKNGNQITPVRPELKCIAEKLGVSLLNSSGNPFNTRQLGSLIIKTLQMEKKTIDSLDESTDEREQFNYGMTA